MEHVAATDVPPDTGGTRDYTSDFEKAPKFKSIEDLKKWACEVGRLHGFVITTFKSDSGERGKKRRVILACERSGKCDSRSSSENTKKCDCPFRLCGEKLADSDEWKLNVGKGEHNHAAGRPKKGNSSQGRLSQEEKSVVKDMNKQGKKPKEILRALQEMDKSNKSTQRTIYNEIQRIRRIEERKRIEDEPVNARESYIMKQLMSRAEKYNYTVKHRPNPNKDHVSDFFLTHGPHSFELLRAFPTVLVIYIDPADEYDSWFGLEFWGVTSTRMIFHVASAILYPEYCNYEWALNSFRGEMDDKGIPMPDIVILDSGRDVIEMCRPINDVFSAAKLLISTNFADDLFHYYLDLKGCSYETWKLLKASPTEADFGRVMQLLRTELDEGVLETGLEPYKEMFVAAWTDKFMHFGCRKLPTTYFWPSLSIIYECGDSVVVKQTEIDRFWEGMHSENEKIRLEIDGSFWESLKNEYTDDKDGLPVLKELYGSISIYALTLIREQTLLADIIDDDHSECTCAIKRTHGLPCAHDIAEYKRRGLHIPLDCINPHWKQLPHLKPYTRTREPDVHQTMKRPRLSEDIGGFQQLTNTYTHSAISLPSIDSSEDNPPNVGPSTVPSTQEWQPRDEVNDIQQITKQPEFPDICPPELRPYILDVRDVPTDGHCGFRAIASFMGYREEDNSRKVREHLKKELMIEKTYYSQLFGWERVNELYAALAYFDSSYLPKTYWMTMPDMGLIIASCYSVVLVHLSSDQCFTFFPFKTQPTPSSVSSTREIVIGYHREHFYQVYWKEGHPIIPMPPVPAPTKKRIDVALATREQIYEQRSADWASEFSSRIKHFKSLQTEVVPPENPSLLHFNSSPSNSV